MRFIILRFSDYVLRGSPFKVGDVLVVVLVAHANDLEQQLIPVFCNDNDNESIPPQTKL